MAEFSDRGFFRANPEADEDNTLRLPGCGDDKGTVEQDVSETVNLSSPTHNGFSGVYYKGRGMTTSVFIAFPALVKITTSSQYPLLANAIMSALEPYEVDPYCLVEGLGMNPNIKVTHIGAGSVTGLQYNGTTDTGTFTRSPL